MCTIFLGCFAFYLLALVADMIRRYHYCVLYFDMFAILLIFQSYTRFAHFPFAIMFAFMLYSVGFACCAPVEVRQVPLSCFLIH